jgi:transposase InsO family protein
VNLWPFIEAEEVEQGNVKRTCELLEVSRAAFYEYHKHVPSRRAVSDAGLSEKIKQIHAESKGTYGAPRIHAELRDQGFHVGKKRVARLMVLAGLAGRCPKRWRKTTIADPDAETRAVDLIRRHFGTGVEVNTRWCGDITYIPTWEGWAYLATVIDIASRRVVGWALADHLRTDLVADALRMACHQRRPSKGVIFHSDRGCQPSTPAATTPSWPSNWASRCRWAARANAGTTPFPKAGSRRSKSS